MPFNAATELNSATIAAAAAGKVTQHNRLRKEVDLLPLLYFRTNFCQAEIPWEQLTSIKLPNNLNRGCLVRFTHMWYQISPCSWLGFWHLPQFKLRLGNHISDLRSQNWGQHSGFSEENRPKVGFFWKFQKMQFPAFGFKKWDFFWVWGVGKGPTNFFPCQKA